MTATDELRRLLDERGVEWWEATPCKTKWSSPILGGPVAAREWNGEMVLDTGYIAVTLEQAIAATLDGGYQGFWTHDGTLHIELPKLPESISVRLPDKRDREVRSARVWQYTLGDSDATRERQGDAGTCRKVYLVETSDDLLESWFPLTVYLHREAAEDCAEALRKENDGIWQFARVTELKVVDE